jgi:hypothetical protein
MTIAPWTLPLPFIDIMSGIPCIGIDIITNKICAVHQDVLPVNCSALGARPKSRKQSNFKAIHLSNMQIREECTRCAQGGLNLELSFNSILPSPDPFGDREDDASSINLPRVINRLVETGESRQLHPSRHVASNILSCLGIVAVVALLGVFIQLEAEASAANGGGCCSESSKHLM